MKQAQSKQVSENPFFGKRALLSMQRTLERTADEQANRSTVNLLLNAAWQEAKTPEEIQLFFILMFSMGDIENRQHNMFPVKVDQGGHSKRKLFRQCLQWTLDTPSARENFYKLLPVIAEYTNYENMFYNQLRTDVKSKKVTSYEVMNIDKTQVAEYIALKLSTATDYEKQLIAKFLPKIPKTKRWRKGKDGKSYAQPKREATLQKDKWNVELISAIKLSCSWTSEQYVAFRSHWLQNTEAHLFSSKKICEMDKIQFANWLDQLPSGARYRVQRRLLGKGENKNSTILVSKGKWKLKTGEDMAAVYNKWMSDKEEAMKKLASLSEADKKAMLTTDLKKLTKTAKITTGATTLYDAFTEMYSGEGYGRDTLNVNNSETQVKIQQLVDKIKIDVPVLVILDNSGSMNGPILAQGGKYIERMQFAKFVATLMLYKNPSPELKNFFIKFNTTASVVHDGAYLETKVGINRFLATSQDTRVDELVRKGKPFIETFKQIDKLISTTGTTCINSVSRALKSWVDEDPQSKDMKIEAIQAYPVFLIISDGDLNNDTDPNKSITQFKQEMLQWFGASPVVVLWDIVNDGRDKSRVFENVDNMIHVAGMNAAVINQIFLNINDIDILDVYITLKTTFESNRYEVVKKLLK